VEDEHGLLWPLADLRWVERVQVAGTDAEFRRALRALIARVGDVLAWEDAPLPDVVYRAQSMQLKWHDLATGMLDCQETLHASDNFYNRGPWYDAVRAQHLVAQVGDMRRLPEERSARERRAVAAAGPGYHWDGMTDDVALIRGLYWFVIPDGVERAGEVQPCIYVQWQRFFNAFAHMRTGDGQGANMTRCRELLAEWDIEGVKPDPLEYLCMLQPDEVSGMVYLQNGYFTPRAGQPDFYWVDTMWEKM